MRLQAIVMLLTTVSTSFVLGLVLNTPTTGIAKSKKAIIIAEYLNDDAATQCGYNDSKDIQKTLLTRFSFNQTEVKQILVKNRETIWRDSLFSIIELGAMEAPEILLIYYSGHGGQMKDVNGDEVDSLDEYLSLGNETILDDDLAELFKRFSKKTEILFITDCCNAGTIHQLSKFEIGMIDSNMMTNHADLLHIGAVADSENTKCIGGNSIFSKELINILNSYRQISYREFCEKLTHKFKPTIINSNKDNISEIGFIDKKLFK